MEKGQASLAENPAGKIRREQARNGNGVNRIPLIGRRSRTLSVSD